MYGLLKEKLNKLILLFAALSSCLCWKFVSRDSCIMATQQINSGMNSRNRQV